eukprot:15445297-Alexandrium_andersonii.AAC.1
MCACAASQALAGGPGRRLAAHAHMVRTVVLLPRATLEGRTALEARLAIAVRPSTASAADPDTDHVHIEGTTSLLHLLAVAAALPLAAPPRA